MPHHRRRHVLYHLGEAHVAARAHQLSRRTRDDALPSHEAAWVLERTLRPSLFSDEREQLVAVAQQLGVVTSDYDLHRVSSSSLFERIHREVSEGRALLVPALALDARGLGESQSYGEAALAAADIELKQLRRIYGGLFDSKGTLAYVYRKNGQWRCRAQEYLHHRDAFIGSGATYDAYITAARAELDANRKALRDRVDPPVGPIRDNNSDWREAQDVFYAWTRRAYEQQLGTGANVPALIKAGTSDKLRAALQQVRLRAGVHFQSGGFNPRPMKTPQGYRLGSLSDHALGTAVDIDTTTNLQIKAAWWANLTAFVGVSLDVATRKSLWKSNPVELHRRIKDLNDGFVAKLTAATGAEAAKPQAPGTSALTAAVRADPHLAQIKIENVQHWRAGFFALPWSLVHELHAAGFLWGATFTTVDLHHFQIENEI